MKNQIKTFFVFVLLCWGCEDIGVTLKDTNVGQVGVVKGTTTYREVLTDQVISGNAEIITEINASTGEAIPREVSKISKGSTFEFGPLPFGTYSINFSLQDSLTGILYKNQLNDLTISKDSESLFREVELIPVDQTVIIARVTTPDDRPVVNANVFLYNDSTLLKTYEGSGGFLDSGVTNKLGKAAFVNHAPGDYFLYPILIVEEDTLTRDITNLIPQNVAAETLTEITVELEFNNK